MQNKMSPDNDSAQFSMQFVEFPDFPWPMPIVMRTATDMWLPWNTIVAAIEWTMREKAKVRWPEWHPVQPVERREAALASRRNIYGEHLYNVEIPLTASHLITAASSFTGSIAIRANKRLVMLDCARVYTDQSLYLGAACIVDIDTDSPAYGKYNSSCLKGEIFLMSDVEQLNPFAIEHLAPELGIEALALQAADTRFFHTRPGA